MARGARPKIDLAVALLLICSTPDEEYAALVVRFQETFGCRERAAKHALGILAKGGWAEARVVKSDRRRRAYRITEAGEEALRTWDGIRRVRFARRLRLMERPKTDDFGFIAAFQAL